MEYIYQFNIPLKTYICVFFVFFNIFNFNDDLNRDYTYTRMKVSANGDSIFMCRSDN